MIEMIKDTLRKRLNELNITKKDIYGHGSYHNVYQSKTNPDRVYKVGSLSVVNTWIDIFKRYPEYFPHVFRSGPLTLKDKTKKAYFVELEKLDTRSVRSDWDYIFFEVGKLNCAKKRDENDLNNIFDDITDDPAYIKEVLAELKRKNQKVYKNFSEWVNLIHNVYNIVPGNLDVHAGNFGYDKNGNKKCLDI